MPHPAGDPRWNFEGGAGRLVFRDAAGRHTFSIEPRFGDETTSRVFLSLNLHKEEKKLPSEGELWTSLNDLWTEAEAFMNRLDEREVS